MTHLPLLLQRKILASFKDPAYDLHDTSVLDDIAVQEFIRFFGCEPYGLNMDELCNAMESFSTYPLPRGTDERETHNNLFECLHVHGIEALDTFTMQLTKVSFKSAYERCLKIPILEIDDNDSNPYSIFSSTTYVKKGYPDQSMILESGDLYAGSAFGQVLSKMQTVVELCEARHSFDIVKDAFLSGSTIEMRKGHERLFSLVCLPELKEERVDRGFMLDWSTLDVIGMKYQDSQALIKSLSGNDRRVVGKKLVSSDLDL